jgi:peptide/nickel transport system permease protein
MLPGDPVDIILGSSDTFQPTQEQKAIVRKQLGLDRPLPVQYTSYFYNLLRGNLGVSFATGRPVALDLRLRFGRTVQLVIPAICLSSVAGITIGVFSAGRRGTLLDMVSSAAGLVAHCLPAFVLGNMLVLMLAIRYPVLPSSGFIEMSVDLRAALAFMVLPVVTMGARGGASTMRMTRMAIVEQMMQDYVRTAKAKGLSERLVLYRHVLKNSMLPVVTVIGLQFGSMLAGAVVVEGIFNWPGLASLLIRSISNRDYPVIQGCVLLMSSIFVVVNFLTDMSYAFLDPRIRQD